MTENIVVVTRTMDVVWMPYTGTHMFTGSLPEDSLTKSFLI